MGGIQFFVSGWDIILLKNFSKGLGGYNLMLWVAMVDGGVGFGQLDAQPTNSIWDII